MKYDFGEEEHGKRKELSVYILKNLMTSLPLINNSGYLFSMLRS